MLLFLKLFCFALCFVSAFIYFFVCLFVFSFSGGTRIFVWGHRGGRIDSEGRKSKNVLKMADQVGSFLSSDWGEQVGAEPPTGEANVPMPPTLVPPQFALLCFSAAIKEMIGSQFAQFDHCSKTLHFAFYLKLLAKPRNLLYHLLQNFVLLYSTKLYCIKLYLNLTSLYKTLWSTLCTLTICQNVSLLNLIFYQIYKPLILHNFMKLYKSKTILLYLIHHKCTLQNFTIKIYV